MSSCGVELYRSSQNRWYRVLYTVYQGYLYQGCVCLLLLLTVWRGPTIMHVSWCSMTVKHVQCTSGLFRVPGRPTEAFHYFFSERLFEIIDNENIIDFIKMLIFTALQLCSHSIAMSDPSVRLSVCQTRRLWKKRKKLLPKFLYHMKDMKERCI